MQPARARETTKRARRAAAALQAILDAAERWDRTFPPFRPAGNLRHLPPLDAELRAVIRLLRTEPSVEQAVNLAEQLLHQPGSALYNGQTDALVRELGRIRFHLLDAGPPTLAAEGSPQADRQRPATQLARRVRARLHRG
jgi:hypothetical protein